MTEQKSEADSVQKDPASRTDLIPGTNNRNRTATRVRERIAAAEEIHDEPPPVTGQLINQSATEEERPDIRPKPRLLVEPSSPDSTVSKLSDILSCARVLYDRGMPVHLVYDQMSKGVFAQAIRPQALVHLAHKVCRPYTVKNTEEVDVRLPLYIAEMYLEDRGGWRLPPLNGIASAPLLRDDGTIFCHDGYDSITGMWLESVPDIEAHIPDKPTIDDAKTALNLIRETFRSFCFADAETLIDPHSETRVVDTAKPPGRDETAFLNALFSAVCRPSLPLCPAFLCRAASMSGAGAGKGLLARCIAMVAYGREPYAVTGGFGTAEIEKRIASELIEGHPVLFLDNLNNMAFKSDLLASTITERTARVRVLGRSEMLPLNASAFVILTGNGLTVSEDLARRFIVIEFDAHTEDPETRTFPNDIFADVRIWRNLLLAAVLTIWRWGRIETSFKPGRMLGSFEQWCSWVRDPLLALGCQDPAVRIGEAKERDGRRQTIAELFTTWWDRHQDEPIAIRDLHSDVLDIADSHQRGRQFQSAYLTKLDGTRMAGFILSRQPAAGKWGTATYVLKKTNVQSP